MNKQLFRIATPVLGLLLAASLPTGAFAQSTSSWALDRIDEVFRPLDGQYGIHENGSGVHLYIIDTGINPSSEFGTRLADGVDLTGNYTHGKIDNCGHGTAVASVAAGNTRGAAKGATIYPVKIANSSFNCVVAPHLVDDAVQWVIDNHTDPAVINFSHRVVTGASGIVDKLEDALAAGITVVLSANNQGQADCGGDLIPKMSLTTAAVTVGGTTSSDSRWSGSNYGSCVTIWAPGDDVAILGTELYAGSSTADGTSFSAPLVAGAAAHYLQRNPTASPGTVRTALLAHATPVEIDSTVSGQEELLMTKPTNACFTWSCNSSTHQCTFNRTCGRIPTSWALYYWDFGDGTAGYDSRTSFTHQFPGSNLYTVELTVDPSGSWTSDSDSGCANTTGAGIFGCTSTTSD